MEPDFKYIPSMLYGDQPPGPDTEQNRDQSPGWDLDLNWIQSPAAPIVLTGSLILISAVTIVIATLSLWNLPLGNGTLQLLLCFFLGAFLALPTLTAIWAALGSQIWIIRVPSALAAESFLLCVYLGTISVFSLGAPPEVYWLVSICAGAVTVAAHVPLWIMRIWLSVQIAGPHLKERSASESQFSIFHLLIATTVVAITIPLIQWLISLGESDGMGTIPIWSVVGFCGIFILLMGLLTTLSIAIVFASKKIKAWCVSILCVVILVIPFAVVQNLSTVIGGIPPTERDAVRMNVASFSISHLATLILVLSLYYALGFRLRRRVLAD